MRLHAPLLGVVLMAFLLPALGAPKAELWERWTANTKSKVAIDHGDWNAFLGQYVKPGADGINRVAHAAVTAAEREKLQGYLEKMQSVPIGRFTRSEQRAYWINLYNAATVRVILDHYPVASIMKINISPGLFVRGPWRKKLLKVEGVAISLDDIEHRILRPIWQDPRTHYSVNCASVGCPNLAVRAYTSGNMEEMLDAGARAYINHPRGVAVKDGKLTVSSIYVWFKSDFAGSDAGVIAHLEKHADPPLTQALAGVTKISNDRYDWSLNDAR